MIFIYYLIGAITLALLSYAYMVIFAMPDPSEPFYRPKKNKQASLFKHIFRPSKDRYKS